MKKLAVILIIFTAFYSCKNEENKLRFVDAVIKSPDKFERILAKDSSFKEDIFVKKYFSDDSTKKAFIKKFKYELDKYILPKYELLCSREVDKYIEQSGDREYAHELVIKGKSEIMLRFIWVLRYGKWQFLDIEFTSSVNCN